MNARDPPCLPLAVGERGPSGHRPVAVWWMTRAGTGLPNSAHRAGTLVSAWPIDARARRKFAGVILNGAPPSQPCSRADARPAFVPSEMSARSNSAMAAKIPRTSSPETVVVVAIAAPCLVKTRSDYVTASWPLFRGIPRSATSPPGPGDLAPVRPKYPMLAPPRRSPQPQRAWPVAHSRHQK